MNGYAKKAETLEFGPELLDTFFEHALGLDRDGLKNDPPGRAHPGAFLNSSWPIWPMICPDTREVQQISGIPRLVHGNRDRAGQVQENLLGVHWNSRYTSNSWQWNYQTKYKILCEEQKTRSTSSNALGRHHCSLPEPRNHHIRSSSCWSRLRIRLQHIYSPEHWDEVTCPSYRHKRYSLDPRSCIRTLHIGI
jgi:hypothetical protein